MSKTPMNMKVSPRLKPANGLLPVTTTVTNPRGERVRIEASLMGPSVHAIYTVEGAALPFRTRLIRNAPQSREQLRDLLAALEAEVA